MGTLTEPIVEPETEGPAVPEVHMPEVRRRRVRSGLRLWFRRAFVAAIMLGAIPAVLTILYFPSFVHPVSTLMLKDLVDVLRLRSPLGAARRRRPDRWSIR